MKSVLEYKKATINITEEKSIKNRVRMLTS